MKYLRLCTHAQYILDNLLNLVTRSSHVITIECLRDALMNQKIVSQGTV